MFGGYSRNEKDKHSPYDLPLGIADLSIDS